MQELKKMYRIHLAKPTRDTFTNEVLPVSNGDWKTFNNPRKIKLLKKRPKMSGVRDDTNEQRGKNSSLVTDIPAFTFAQAEVSNQTLRLLTKSPVKRTTYCLKYTQ